jgi:hypothetical protein
MAEPFVANEQTPDRYRLPAPISCDKLNLVKALR